MSSNQIITVGDFISVDNPNSEFHKRSGKVISRASSLMWNVEIGDDADESIPFFTEELVVQKHEKEHNA